MNNYNNPPKLSFHPVAVGTFLVAAAGSAYVDTDVSATTGTNINRLWLVNARNNNSGTARNYGVRKHGETVDPKFSSWSSFWLTYVDVNGHVDLYRNATEQAEYYFIGYFE